MALGLTNKVLADVRKYAQSMHEDMIKEVIAICEIPAPSYHEEKRAAYIMKRFQDYGLEAYIDEVNNVIAYAPANVEGKPALMFAGHIDTVFPAGIDVTVTRKGNKLYAPGIRDNSAGAAGVVMLARALQDLDIEHGDLYLVGTACEEGLGDLRGMKAAYQVLKDKIDYVIGVDGGLGGMIHAGIGSRRLKVTVTTGGGHSWGAFGVPSAIHVLGKMIGQIADIKVPKDPKTSFNVGVIEGGTSINTIAASASMLIDMRSVQLGPLQRVEKEVRQIIEHTAAAQDVAVAIEVVGDRPVGYLNADHPLVKTASDVLGYLGLPKRSGASSTDCNVPLSDGKPAVCVGVTTGKYGHRVDEIMDIDPLPLGLEQLILLLMLLK